MTQPAGQPTGADVIAEMIKRILTGGCPHDADAPCRPCIVSRGVKAFLRLDSQAPAMLALLYAAKFCSMTQPAGQPTPDPGYCDRCTLHGMRHVKLCDLHAQALAMLEENTKLKVDNAAMLALLRRVATISADTLGTRSVKLEAQSILRTLDGGGRT